MADKQEIKFKPGCGVDVGTSNLCFSRMTEDGVFVNRYHRDALYELDASDEAVDLLERSDYLYVKTDDKYYIIGDDSLKFINAVGGGNLIRPMKCGVLNPELRSSSELLFFIISALVGKPLTEGEPLRYSIPANPIDRNLDNRFHQMVLNGFFNKLGYVSKDINEGMALAFDCSPIMKTKEGDVPLSGISMSFGGGMINVALLYRGMELHTFSVTASGDMIDENVAKVTGIPTSKVIKIKERELDLDNINSNDRVSVALSIYYDEMLERVVRHVVNYFKDKKTELEGDVQIVVGGGTSMALGFINRLRGVFDRYKKDLPFNIYDIRHSPSPFYSVVQGATIRARADYEKSIKK